MKIQPEEILNFFEQSTQREVPEDLAEVAICCEYGHSLLGAVVFFLLACAALCFPFFIISAPENGNKFFLILAMWLHPSQNIEIFVSFYAFFSLLIISGVFFWIHRGICKNVNRLISEGRLTKGRVDRIKRSGRPHGGSLYYAVVSFQADGVIPAIRFGPLAWSDRLRCEEWRENGTAVNVLYLPDEIGSFTPSVFNEYVNFMNVPDIWDYANPKGRAALIDVWIEKAQIFCDDERMRSLLEGVNKR